MILKIDKKISDNNLNLIIERIEEYNCSYVFNEGEQYNVIGIIGKTNHIDEGKFSVIDGVASVTRITVPYKLASREFKETNTNIVVNNQVFGQDKTIIIAGPCAVETREQVMAIAKYVSDSNIKILRGGIVKPRTSPYSFQGLQQDGLNIMLEAKEKYGLAICCELMNIEQVNTMSDDIDIIQIGARNMQNYDLLKAVGKINKPVLLKRGLSATIEEFLMAAEYIMSYGNHNVILCERGIRTFENAYRNVTDINAIVMLKALTHLPVICDPSHSTGKEWMVEKIALAATVAGADGLIVETHYQPTLALSDGQQALNPTQFKDLCVKIKKIDQFILNENI